METHTTLSKLEKRHQFIYLLGMVVLVIIVFGVILINKFSSPFSGTDVFEIQLLEQKNKFNEQQVAVIPLLETTYKKITILKLETPQQFAENDIKNSINDIANSFENANIYDTRKEGFYQIAKFYKMYFEDKKIAAKKTENINLFQKQFEECSIGFKANEEQLAQKKNAILSRGAQ